MRSDPEGIALREGDYEYAWGVCEELNHQMR